MSGYGLDQSVAHRPADGDAGVAGGLVRRVLSLAGAPEFRL